MTWVAGADGCPAGWTIVWRAADTGDLDVEVVRCIAEVLLREDRNLARLAIDMPIGLLDAAARGGRDADREARRLLGGRRGSSVFPAPVRAVLDAADFEEAREVSRRSSPEAIAVSAQAFGLVDKIREVDRLVSPARQDRIVEVHPELSFFEMNDGSPVVPPKRSEEGFEARIALLERAWSRPLRDFVEASASSGAARDDIVDAMAACWSAERVRRGTAIRVPADPPRDARGLRMEIVR